MATVVSAKFDFALRFAEAFSGNFAEGGPGRFFDLSGLQTTRLANGTSAGQVDKCHVRKDAAISGGGTADVEFVASLLDSEGAAITFAKIKVLMFYNSGTVSIKIKAKTGDALPWFDGTTDSVVLKAGDCLPFFSPIGITVAGATSSITITNTSGGTAAAYTMFVAGTSV